MHKKKSTSNLLARVSFPVTPLQLKGLNVIYEKTGLSFGEICAKAIDKILDEYVRDGEFRYPDETPVMDFQELSEDYPVIKHIATTISGFDDRNLI